MTNPVHILATVRRRDLLPAALLVFRTLRIGFPTSPVFVWGNSLDPESARQVSNATASCGGVFQNITPTVHDRWIETIIDNTLAPFWICDTDMVFWERVEHWSLPTHFSGRLEPEFHEDWTDTRHVERLHTSLMVFNPVPLRGAIRAWACQLPVVWRDCAEFPFIRMHFIPVRGSKPLCYDTCAGLWQAGLGTPFTPAQNAAYDHLHCATYVDTITTELRENLVAAHSRVYANHEAARGFREQQQDYYKARRVPSVICSGSKLDEVPVT